MGKRVDGKPNIPKASKVEELYRINRLFNLIRNGGTRTDCLRMAANEWDMRESTCDALLRKVRQMLRSDFDKQRDMFAAELMQQCSSIHMEARRTGNLSAAIQAVNTLAKIAQLV